MILIVPVRIDGRSRRPDVPEGVSFRVVRDLGEEVEVELTGPEAEKLAEEERRKSHLRKSTIIDRLQDAELEPVLDTLEALRAGTAKGIARVQQKRLAAIWDASRSLNRGRPEWQDLEGMLVKVLGQVHGDEATGAARAGEVLDVEES